MKPNPSVTEGIGFINYAWSELGLRVLAERYTDDGYAELSFYSGNGSSESLLHTTRVNLMATPTMTSLVKRLEKNSADIPWTDILTFITGKTLEIARRGEPAIEIWPSENDNLTPDYLLEPILYMNHPAVIFGDYGSLKSLAALVIGYIVQLPYHDNDLGLITRTESTLCLYLDYEDDAGSFRRRWSALEKGFGKGAMPILYRRMTGTLSDSIEQLQRIIHDKNISLIIVDSLGPAARGNLNDPEPAIKYHAALRQLGVTSLTLAHTSKDQLTKRRTIFGSVFFTNLARSVWECRAEQETGEDEAIISLKHTKANLSRLHPPLGYRFTFTDNSITVVKADLRDTGLSGELPLSLRIKDLLRGGALTVKEIAEALEANEASVRTITNRLSKKGYLIKVGESWGLKQEA
ncbi:MAG TPA: AAA family ATPase [Dehalococcoidia bacterium]|nr:AAA family ATPase [Dehalococcoidia bacterium]